MSAAGYVLLVADRRLADRDRRLIATSDVAVTSVTDDPRQALAAAWRIGTAQDRYRVRIHAEWILKLTLTRCRRPWLSRSSSASPRRPRRQSQRRVLSRPTGFLFGVAVSVTCNVASAAPTWPARGVAAIPAVSLLLAVEVLVRSTAVRRATPRPAPAAASRSGHNGRRPRGQATAAVRSAMAAAPNASVAELARLAGVSRSTVRRVSGGPS